MRRAAGALTLSLLVIVATASVAPAKRAKHACGLLKPTEIATVLVAADVSKGTRGEIPGTCQWDVDGGPDAGGGLVATALERGSDAKDSFELARDLAGGDLVEVDGLGRRAFFALDAVYVLASKRTFFYVQALMPVTEGEDGVTVQGDLEALAAIAARRV